MTCHRGMLTGLGGGGLEEYDTCLLYLKSIQTFNLLLINGTGFVNLTILLILQDLLCLDTFHRRNNDTVLLEIWLRGTFLLTDIVLSAGYTVCSSLYSLYTLLGVFNFHCFRWKQLLLSFKRLNSINASRYILQKNDS